MIWIYWNTTIGEGNVDLYSASSRKPLTRSDMDHTVLHANNTISAFTRKHSPGGATTHIRIANAWVQRTTHLSTAREWMAELALLADIPQTAYPKEVRRQQHVMAQRRESSRVIERCSNHCATPSTNTIKQSIDVWSPVTYSIQYKLQSTQLFKLILLFHTFSKLIEDSTTVYHTGYRQE